jgi:Protein of unknown function (DUF2889)
MLIVPDRAGPARPRASSPARELGSVRRTTSIDSCHPHGMSGPIEVDARARDLRTGDGAWAHEQRMTATLGVDRAIVAIEAQPAEPLVARLVGAIVGPGFRAHMTELLPGHADRRTLLHTLLDDLPGAALVSGYAMQRTTPPILPVSGSRYAQHVKVAEDMCAGWASDATIVVTFRATGEIPHPMGPPAPALERPGDPRSWHDMEPLPPESTRRRRRLDLLPPSGDSGAWAFNSHFRDSYCDAEGLETAIHEYQVDGWIDEDRRHLGDVQAQALVLPWVECPGAVASADRLAGRLLADLRAEVRAEFVGTGTCTHLNDSFRVLADLEPLLHLAGADPG